jgi:hypothetical protein
MSTTADKDDAEKPTDALVEEYSQIAIFAQRPEVAVREADRHWAASAPSEENPPIAECLRRIQ